MSLLPILYAVASFSLALYGLQALLLTLLYLWPTLSNTNLPVRPAKGQWPLLTVQLPLFNEKEVSRRLLQAVVHLDYPRSRLQIQVLDDSNDETTLLLQRDILHYRTRGYWIDIVRRRERNGFKAGALAAGFPTAVGEYIAIFDADFVPLTDWVRRAVTALRQHPHWAFVQTRWAHLNSNASWLTKAQMLALDGHFVVEQGARSRFGLPFGFNGSAGLWRREAIAEAGGWQADTLCEDLDLSYRAQLCGWQAGYLPEVSAPAELPPLMTAWKQQQFRWAKGSVQVMRKLAGSIIRNNRWPWTMKIAAFWHLSGYISHLFLLLLLVLLLPMLYLHLPWAPFLAPIGFLGLGPLLLYTVSQKRLYPNWGWHLMAMPFLMAIGVGLALNNSIAVLEGALGLNSPFRRTPKYNLAGDDNRWLGRGYTPPVDRRILGELLLALYALLTFSIAWQQGNWPLLPFLALYVTGFSWASLQSLYEQQVAIHYTRRAQVRRSLS